MADIDLKGLCLGEDDLVGCRIGIKVLGLLRNQERFNKAISKIE
jgi:hypothetical protein